jgi:hypothetical protein
LEIQYPDVGHDVWTRAYVDPAFADWLFGERRIGSPTPGRITPPEDDPIE